MRYLVPSTLFSMCLCTKKSWHTRDLTGAFLLQAAELLSMLEALLLTFHQHLCGGYQQRLGSTQVRRRVMTDSLLATCLWTLLLCLLVCTPQTQVWAPCPLIACLEFWTWSGQQ